MAGENPFRKYVTPQQPSVTPLPESPSARADRERADAAAARDAEAAARDAARTGIAVRGEGRDIGYRQYDNTLKLRSDFDAMPEVKNYRTAIPLFVQGLKTADTPQGSNALIYAYAKIMDPGSVVRESEAEGVANSDTIFGRAYAYAQKQLEGNGTFSPAARAGLINEMRTKTIELARSYDAQRNRFEADAQAFGIDPERVVGPHDGSPFVAELREFDQHAEQDKAVEPAGAGVIERDGLSGRVTDESPNTYQDSLAGQGMSGVNEGIASTLGFPVDALTSVMNLVPQGINAVANTEIPSITDPFMGSGWWNDKFQDWAIYDPTDDAGDQFARRVGQSVGAASVPLVGSAGTVGNLGRGLLASGAGGVGAATAQQVVPGNIGAEIAAELLASGGAGLGTAAISRRGAQQALEGAIPTVPQLKEQATDLYRRAEASGATAGPMETEQLANALRNTLRQEGRVSPTGRVSEVYPKTREAMQLVEDYSGQPMSPTQMQTVRGVIADGLQSPENSERRIARLLMDEFDEWAEPLVPGLTPAREVSSRYLTAETLEQARELAEARAAQFSGSGLENALRTEYRSLDRNAIKGRERFSDPLLEAVENVSRGTPYSNTVRGLGRLAPTGSVSFGLGTVAPATLGTMVAGPVGGLAAGGLTGGLGIAGRVLATKATDRSAEIAELIARNGGAIPQAPMMTPEIERTLAAALGGQAGTYIGDDENGEPIYLQ